MPVNLTTLSKILEVSPGTISRVLNNHASQRISEDRRRYIIEGAKKHGYQPSSAARSLATQKTLCVGLVMHYGTSPINLVNPNTIGDLMMSLERTLQKSGYGLNLLFISREKPELSFSDLLQRRLSFDALVFPSGVATKGIVDFAQHKRIPHAIICDKEALDWPGNYFHFDEVADVKEAVTFLKGQGHREIGFIGWDKSRRLQKNSLSLYVAEQLKSQGLVPRENWLRTVSDDADSFLSYRDHGRIEMQKLLRQREAPSAIVASHDMIALGACDVIKECCNGSEQRISVIGWGDLEGLTPDSNHEPFLTTFSPPTRELGEAAAKSLLEQIDDPDTSFVSKVFPSRLIVRSSTTRCDVMSEKEEDAYARVLAASSKAVYEAADTHV